MIQQCRTKVVMADQHAMLAQSLGLVFEMRHYSYRVVPIAGDSAGHQDVLRQVLALRPDVLLVNADLGPCNGISLIAPVVRSGAAVVVITETSDEAKWGECLLQGARTVLAKTSSLATVISTVRRVSRNEPVLDRAERTRLLEAYRQQSSHAIETRQRLDRLTRQEGEVLRHLIAGRTVSEIADVRVVAEGTVRTQVKSILAKLDLRSQLAAVAAARGAGWDGGATVIHP